MKYKYDVVGESKSNANNIKAPALASLIKRDVKVGKWNLYEGGVDGKNTAKISYKGSNWEHSEHLYIYGSKREIQFLEKLIKPIIQVIPRKYLS